MSVEDERFNLTWYKTEVKRLEEELAQYKADEANGLLIKLPCKVGDTLWYIADGKVESAELKAIRINISREVNGVSFEGIIPLGAYVYSWVIGQMLYITREAAEAALLKAGC